MATRTGFIRWGLTAALAAILVIVGTAVALAQGGPPGQSPGASYRIVLAVDEQTFEGFVGVSGLDSESEVIEFREGAEDTVRKLPGDTKYGDIRLERGLIGIDDLSVWREAIADGETDRRDGSVIIFDARGQEVARWNFTNGWPSKWEGPTLSLDGSEAQVEAITLTVDGLQKE